ncbi:MAG: membrane protein insertion efficiency factor YidD, partial [Rhodospirillales bacterium]|nr:membrane protein insertion efficiency factor YidD [Rhodospirillales bacterium]
MKVTGFSFNAIRLLPRRTATGLIRGYQLLVSPVLPGNCRFYPTCSSYAIDAFTHHGPLKGAWLSIHRIARCHPWGES